MDGYDHPDDETHRTAFACFNARQLLGATHQLCHALGARTAAPSSAAEDAALAAVAEEAFLHALAGFLALHRYIRHEICDARIAALVQLSPDELAHWADEWQKRSYLASMDLLEPGSPV